MQIRIINKAAAYGRMTRADSHSEEDVAPSSCLGLLLAFIPVHRALRFVTSSVKDALEHEKLVTFFW
jgi:hypothetical protein